MDRLNYFLQLLEKDPNNPLVHYSLALEYKKKGHLEKAIEHMEKYLSMKEDEGAAYRLLAECYQELGDYEKAARALEEGIKQAVKFNHPSMVQEYRQWLEDLRTSWPS
ncbi:TPR repeat-containing protein [Thermocrinis albus DSM 14484]|uniref:TPR repeat-containing protein n=1 Tax=Thermocrinis albus (strain DSM 14484 / JCM 11386 / HI 11/12) TaxID=638303 RepID=D3SLS0_THEAH|nr:tetratricopeptide repeat protein [Thermocrinis albus]ADC89700.1 TPR repeat-containing protein [Thermocrinis albus DSM 14484]